MHNKHLHKTTLVPWNVHASSFDAQRVPHWVVDFSKVDTEVVQRTAFLYSTVLSLTQGKAGWCGRLSTSLIRWTPWTANSSLQSGHAVHLPTCPGLLCHLLPCWLAFIYLVNCASLSREKGKKICHIQPWHIGPVRWYPNMQKQNLVSTSGAGVDCTLVDFEDPAMIKSLGTQYICIEKNTSTAEPQPWTKPCMSVWIHPPHLCTAKDSSQYIALLLSTFISIYTIGSTAVRQGKYICRVLDLFRVLNLLGS